MAIADVAPGKEGYGRADSYAESDDKSGIVGKSYVPLPPSSPAMGITEKPGYTGPPAAPAAVVSRANRLDWIDGLRGLASLMIFTHHFSDLTWGVQHPEVLEEGSLGGLLKNGQLAVGIYFLLGGRVLAASFLKSAFTVPKAPVVHGDEPSEKPVVPKKPPGPRWLTLSSSLFRRSIRLAFPAIVVGFIQWKVCVDGLMNTTMTVTEQVLAPANMWLPGWCSIGNFAGFLQFCLDLFTERNHQYMLTVGSALWTTYDQFWGSVLVYILAATFAPLPWRGRYMLYGAICVSLWWINSSNMLYVAGLWLADLYAAGFVRKIQDHWKWTVGIELAVTALGLAMIVGGKNVTNPSNIAIGKVTVYAGKYGWFPPGVWPQYMFMSNW